ncbi:MAG: phosphatase PAP2 family protein [Spirochaetia bacterium]|jgi:undecaprenyl-diphosphatase|nr:phosphatase PAP2 family protein [Spirochaetia bacterium]
MGLGHKRNTEFMKLLLLVICLALMSFFVIASIGSTKEFDFLDGIQTYLRSSFMDWLMPLLSLAGKGGAIWIICAVILLFLPDYRKQGYVLLLALLFSVAFCTLLLKPLVGRIRPCNVHWAVQLLIPRPTDFSFPSGHTSASFAAATALYLSGRKNLRLWIPAYVLAALISFSRMYLYVHYPSDIIGGIMVGLLAGNIADAIIVSFEEYASKHRLM